MIPSFLLKAGTQVSESSLKTIVDAWKENERIIAENQTKRHEISALRDIEVTKIQEQGKFLKQYLEGKFTERKIMINGLFDTLDKGIASDNLELMKTSISAILLIAQESPLAGINKVLSDFNDPNVKEIEF